MTEEYTSPIERARLSGKIGGTAPARSEEETREDVDTSKRTNADTFKRTTTKKGGKTTTTTLVDGTIMFRLTVNMPLALKKRLSHYATDTDQDMNDIINTLVEQLLNKEEKRSHKE